MPLRGGAQASQPAATSSRMQLAPLAKGGAIDVPRRVAVVEDIGLGGHYQVHRWTIAAQAPVEMLGRAAAMRAIRHDDEQVDFAARPQVTSRRRSRRELLAP
jgi:hypothetical protein